MTEPIHDGGGELELRDYLAVVRRRKVLIAVVTLLTVAAAVAYSLLQTPIYQSTTEVLIQRSASENVLSDAQQQNPQLVQQQIQTEIQIIQSRSIEDAVRAKLGSLPDISVSSRGDTQVVAISVDDTDARRAATDANGYAETYVAERRRSTGDDLLGAAGDLQAELDRIDAEVADADQKVTDLTARLSVAPIDQVAPLTAERDRAQEAADSARQSSEARRLTIQDQIDRLQLEATLNQTRGPEIVSAAEESSSPISPNPVRNALVAVFLGLLLGVGAAFLREYLDDSVRTKEDLEAVSGGLTTLGLIPRIEGWRDRSDTVIDSIDHPNGPAAEAYRAVRTSLQFLGIDDDLKIVQFTSAGPGEGKTTTSANMAVALSRAGHKVVLVDCDLRKPRVHSFFGMDNSRGFTSVLLGVDSMQEALQRIPSIPRLALLTSGPLPPAPSELLSRKVVEEQLHRLTTVFDYVVVDSPPLLPVADALVLSGYVDALILVANAKSTTKRSLHRAVELLQQVDAPIAGTIFNGVTAEDTYAYGGYGYNAEVEAKAGDDERSSRLLHR